MRMFRASVYRGCLRENSLENYKLVKNNEKIENKATKDKFILAPSPLPYPPAALDLADGSPVGPPLASVGLR